ncbi:adhesion G-protein coupled receptor D2 isoform X2 [Hoplias malabaricus]|uniref:adhesion G-protein coupled receptor D2 isoform X2 n=1 Tax=Hoplias malabaricus TaxID=27720 RepID=UPI00346308AE
MELLKIICSNLIVLIHHCTGKAFANTLINTTLLPEEEIEYVSDRLQREVFSGLCSQLLDTLAVVPSAEENLNRTTYLQSMKTSQPVRRRKMAELSGTSNTLILEFLGRDDHKPALLRHTFLDMRAVTVCSRLRFDPTCHGNSTVFSYSIQSFFNEFQLRASVTQGKPIKLVLLVHGEESTYQPAFANDAKWHSFCVSWTGNGGEWAFSADGREIGRGNHLYPSKHIGGDGLFIIGDKMYTVNESFTRKEAFCGSITQLYIWDRALKASEIQTMERYCKPITSGLLYRWNISGLEVESSQLHLDSVHCQEYSQMPNKDTCKTSYPASKQLGWEICEAQREGVCQYFKETLDNFPKTHFFIQVLMDLQANPGLEELNSTSSTDSELIWLSSLAQSVVRVIEASPNIITSSDLLYLTQSIKEAAAAQVNKTLASSEVITSMATNYLNLASGLIDPVMARQWLGLKTLGIYLRPFMVVENIEKLLWSLADVLFAERTPFTVSTKNIDVHMEPRKLPQMGCSCVYKPSTQTVHSSSQDEILIPETEVQRVYSLGHKDVMLIYSYYSNLLEMLSKTDVRDRGLQQSESVRSPLGSLATAIISATVRDVSRAENIPVSVRYTLSTLKTVEFSKAAIPVCVFWNVSMIAVHEQNWSEKGCTVLYSRPDATSCFCNHTTNFAVLMNYMEWSVEEESILTKLTFIGSGASLCALVVTLMLFTMLDIPRSDRTSIHKNLFISLTLAQIVLLCSGSAVHNKVACTLVAALLHLFFMAAFSWMLVEGLLLWSKVVTVNLSEDRHMKYYYLIGWGLPVLIVTITLASAAGEYSADGYCWLSVHKGVIWGFAGPVIFIIMVNIMVLTRVVVITVSTAKRRSLMLAANSNPVEQASEQIRAAVKAVLVLLPILGLTWLFGVLVPFSIVMAYIFIILNSLQGLFIFLIYGVYNTEIRNTVNRIKERRKAQNFSNCGSSRPSSSVHSSRPGSSPVPSSLGGLGVDASHLGSHSTASDSTSLSYSHERHLSLPCVHGNLEDDPNSLGSTLHMTGQEHAAPVACVTDACSLHVPMDEELVSFKILNSSSEHHSMDPF